MKRVFAAVLAVLMLTLCGCSTVILGNGTLSLEADAVDKIIVTNVLTDGHSFTVQDREVIRTIVSHINSFTLENGTDPLNGGRYNLSLTDSKGDELLALTIVGENTITTDQTYTVNAGELLSYLEAQDCNTMTDQELIDSLLEGDTLERLSILDAEGKISLDKILSLPKSCPALFELLSRPSAIASVGSYGVDKIGEYLNSSNPELVEKAEEWIEILKNLVPELQEKLENLINNQGNSQNNP